MARKRINVQAVLDAIGDRELGRAIRRTLDRVGVEGSKRQFARRFKRELNRRVSTVRIRGRHIKE